MNWPKSSAPIQKWFAEPRFGRSELERQAAGLIFSALAVAATTLLLLPLRQQLNTSTVALLFLAPVLFSTTIWGLGGGVVAAGSAFLAYNYYFLQPYYTLRVHATQDLLALTIFLIVAIVISQLVGQARAGRAAATAREQETIRLYELSRALSGISDPQQVAQVTAQLAQVTFLAAYVEIGAEKTAASPLLSQAPAEASRPANPPEIVAPLQGPGGLQGELRLWRTEPLAETDERLLGAFTAQVGLALERAALAQTRTQARILEESDRLKSALLSSVSHDLRTPLATIKAAITSLQSGEVDWGSPERQELLDVVNEETDHLNYLVGNLLAMSRIESGALQPNRQWNYLAEIIASALVRIRRSLESHRLQVQLPEDLPLIPVDYVQMEQVFINLVSNSLKYAPPGSAITISAWMQSPAQVVVQVHNQGPPVAQEHLERIFEKFYRVTNAERITGTGLGLSICKGIVEAHGGQIWAENLNDGFAFFFSLPAGQPGLAQPNLKPESTGEWA